jgi:exodeoxyribonuclease-3
MRLRIATWNVNSVRLRAEQVARFVAEQAPDVLCLQEIKCQEGEFPARPSWRPACRIWRSRPEGLARRGHRLAPADRTGAHARRLPRGPRPLRLGKVAGVEVHNFYIPAGGDEPDRAINPKFDHKLDFFERLTRTWPDAIPGAPLAILAGDLNVAPGEHDVWNHRFMSKVVSHTPVEVEAMAR